jgi:hypothetical protein
MATASKKVLVPIGTGSEEMEAVITVDVLRRAGALVTIASVEPSLTVKCSRGVTIVADKVSISMLIGQNGCAWSAKLGICRWRSSSMIAWLKAST